MKRIMKKIYAFMVAAIALTAVSCNNEAIDEVVGGENIVNGDYITTLTVGLDNTRTQYSEGKTIWKAGDEISLNGSVYELTNGANSGNGTFSLKEGETPILAGLDNYSVMYPANCDNIPTTQDAVAGSFDPKAAVLGTSTNGLEGLTLCPYHALVKFTVAADSQSVSLLGYTLEGTITAGETYYIAVEPDTYAGLTAVVDEAEVKSTAKEIQLDVRDVLNLGVLPVASDYAIIGTHANNWNFAYTTLLLNEGGDYYVARNISGLDEYKFVNASATGWDATLTYNYGAVSTLPIYGGARVALAKNSANNLKVGDSTKNYDVYLAKDSSHSFVIETGVEIPEHNVSFIGSNDDWNSDILLLPYNANWSVAKNVTITNVGFLLRLNYGWSAKWGNNWGTIDPNDKDVSHFLGKEYIMNKNYDNAEWSGENTACDVYVKTSTIGQNTTTIYVVEAGTAVSLE